jgi:hypothetical protein
VFFDWWGGTICENACRFHNVHHLFAHLKPSLKSHFLLEGIDFDSKMAWWASQAVEIAGREQFIFSWNVSLAAMEEPVKSIFT